MKTTPDNRKKRLGATAVALGICLILTGCTAHKTTNETTSAQSQTAAETGAVIDDLDTADVSGMDFAISDNDADATYSEAGATIITLSGSGATVDGNGATVASGWGRTDALAWTAPSLSYRAFDRLTLHAGFAAASSRLDIHASSVAPLRLLRRTRA